MSLFPPSERTVLWIISKHPETVTISFLMEVAKEVSTKGISPDSNFTKAYAIILELEQKGLIKIGPFKTVVTAKGQWRRIYTHPSLAMWGIITAIVIAVGSIVYVKLSTHTPSSPAQELKPISTGVLHADSQKSLRDSLKKK